MFETTNFFRQIGVLFKKWKILWKMCKPAERMTKFVKKWPNLWKMAKLVQKMAKRAQNMAQPGLHWQRSQGLRDKQISNRLDPCLHSAHLNFQ